MKIKINSISIVVPTYNEDHYIVQLVNRIDAIMKLHHIIYEIIVIDDYSRDYTPKKLLQLANEYPLSFYFKKGKKGKAFSLIQGFEKARYNTIAIIDADLQYPPESIPSMLEKIENGADIVVANRIVKHPSISRRLQIKMHKMLFGSVMRKTKTDALSGLKVIKKEIVEHIPFNGSAWTFDIEFLVNAINAGYIVETQDIIYLKRAGKKSTHNHSISLLQRYLTTLKIQFLRPSVIPFAKKIEKDKGIGFDYKGQSYVHHSQLDVDQTAFHRLSHMQSFIIFSSLAVLGLGFILNWHTTIVIFFALLTLLYFSDLLFNMYVVYRSISNPAEIKVTSDEIAAVNEEDWPFYTVLCPLYKEKNILPQFITAMSNLEYPKDKLQVMLLLEEDDTETISFARNYNLPSYFSIVVVPHSFPKTKPKASNYGLLKAIGEYIVIYDAEDIPDTDQLKKIVLAFAKEDRRTVCIQAKLNFYNPHQNLLTRIFTAEYSLWFDLILTGIQSIHAPIPLGGTSNHFRTKDLHTLKGWDSFNVTEDADLGMRLVKMGYRTAVVDSSTLEEANSGMKNWFWQRSRWIKGYMQTYLLHMRNPKEFMNNWREPHIITFQLIIGGKVTSMFINPLMWVITICYFLFRSHVASFIESFFPTPVLYMGVFSLLVGNFLYLYYYMVGCIKHGHYELVKYALLVPLYWLAMSVAAWIAFYKLLTAPHQWSKTKHGLHLDKKNLAKLVQVNIRKEEIKPLFEDNYLQNKQDKMYIN